MRALAAGLVAFALMFLVTVSGCGGAPKPCTPKSCTGCCDPDGECFAGTGLLECGVSGAKCERCEATDACRLGVCQLLGDGGLYDGGMMIGVGGGSAVGGGAGGGSAGGAGGGAGDAGKPDGGTDAGKPDSGSDAGKPDSGFDAGKPDAGADAGFDSGSASGTDAGGDAGKPDGG